MNEEFVVLTEYHDELEAQMVQSALFDADIDAELEMDRPRGMKAAHGNLTVRVLVRPHDLKRARMMLRKGLNSEGLDIEPDISDLNEADFDSSDSLHEF
ncbi:MAG TPA: hypothetical protein ENH10_05110 [Bacteroidetes bacterium]|nr:hypothetical protein BMS3Bbin04_01985 [bacterium BMS3Bbin04]HDO65396.1 hypothetical protein [Bacteroidota bacterium]HEX04521.1 hypothetical protein [Bacteroidota bacterium]